jgi:hypothetical protein
MDSWMIAFTIAAGVGVVQALLLLLFALENTRFFRSELRSRHCREVLPRVELFVPCKGTDLHFRRMVRAMLRQDYPTYGITFIVESPDDPAYAVLQPLVRQARTARARILVAGHAVACGQKVHNLLAATAGLDPAVELLAFGDSDIQPELNWLRRLVHQLGEPGVGVVTGYRWFLPRAGNRAAAVLAALNGRLLSLLGGHRWNAVWGGAWAIRREVFETLDIRGVWQGALTEDHPVWRAVRQAGLRVFFAPNCLVASEVHTTWAGLVEFARRQYLLTRVYAPGLWWLALVGGLLSNGAFWGTLAVGLGLWWAGRPAWAAPATLALLYALNTAQSWCRHRAVARRFPGHQQTLWRTTVLDAWAHPILALVNLGLLLHSALGWEMTWRGIRYRLDGRGATRILARAPTPARPTVRELAAPDQGSSADLVWEEQGC